MLLWDGPLSRSSASGVSTIVLEKPHSVGSMRKTAGVGAWVHVALLVTKIWPLRSPTLAVGQVSGVVVALERRNAQLSLTISRVAAFTP